MTEDEELKIARECVEKLKAGLLFHKRMREKWNSKEWGDFVNGVESKPVFKKKNFFTTLKGVFKCDSK